jgi:hypothetical protein
MLEPVDRLGIMKATLASVQCEHDELVELVKREFMAKNVTVLEGELYRASFVVTERVALDAKTAAKLLPRSEHPELYSSILAESVRVVARSTQPLRSKESI